MWVRLNPLLRLRWSLMAHRVISLRPNRPIREADIKQLFLTNLDFLVHGLKQKI